MPWKYRGWTSIFWIQWPRAGGVVELLPCAEECWGHRVSKQRSILQPGSWLPSNRCAGCLSWGLLCLAWPGVAWLSERMGAGMQTQRTTSCLLRHAHHSSPPAPPSASGRPGLGAVGRQLSAWRLAVGSNKDVGVFGSPAADDETASDFGEQGRFLELF